MTLLHCEAEFCSRESSGRVLDFSWIQEPMQESGGIFANELDESLKEQMNTYCRCVLNVVQQQQQQRHLLFTLSVSSMCPVRGFRGTCDQVFLTNHHSVTYESDKKISPAGVEMSSKIRIC